MADHLADLNQIFEQDPGIDEMDFLITSEAQFVHVEHKLGIPYPLATVLYNAAHERFLRLQTKQEDFTDESVIQITRAMLLVNGACQSAWNARKKVLSLVPAMYDAELQFAALVLTRHPKSGEIWSHRCVCIFHWMLYSITVTILRVVCCC